MLNESCSQNETCSYTQKPVLVSARVAVLPVFCTGHAVCAVELFSECLDWTGAVLAAWFHTSSACCGPGDCSAPSVSPSMSCVSE